MKPILDSLGRKPFIESITIPNIQSNTNIISPTRKNIVISTYDFWKEVVSSMYDVEYKLTCAWDNIIDGVRRIVDKWLPVENFKNSFIFLIAGLCLFIIGEVLRTIIYKPSSSTFKNKKTKTVVLVKYFIIYSVITCTVVFATMLLIRRLSTPGINEALRLVNEGTTKIPEASGKKNIEEFIRHFIQKLNTEAPELNEPIRMSA